ESIRVCSDQVPKRGDPVLEDDIRGIPVGDRRVWVPACDGRLEVAEALSRRVAVIGSDDDLDTWHPGQAPPLAREEARGDCCDSLGFAFVTQGPEKSPDEQSQVLTVKGRQDSPGKGRNFGGRTRLRR